jgi:DNA polymerase-3 subunit alpha/error-prone DNA polymerase
MGLAQIRDLRRETMRAMIVARRQAAFTSLRDLLARVSLQNKELTHLIQGGALDGLGESRAALLAEAEDVARAGSIAQMAFNFARDTAVPPETAAQRLAWEHHILGQPVTVFPLVLVAGSRDGAIPLRRLPEFPNQSLTIVGVRLPGWTGGSGFFLGDGDTFIIVKLGKSAAGKGKRPLWQPLRLSGRWRSDEWGGCWFQAEEMALLD